MRVQVVCLEAYDSEQDAALAHDRAVLAALGAAAPGTDLNFPPAPAAQHSSQPGSNMAAAAAAGGDNTAGLGSWGVVTTGSVPTAAAAAQHSAASLAPEREYKGVVWDPANQKYQAQALDSSGNVLLLGLYGTAEEAATEYDTRLIKSGMRDESKLNFGLARYLHLLRATTTSHLQQSSNMASSLVAQSSLGMQPAAGDVDARLGAAAGAGSAASGGCTNSPTAAAWPEAEPGGEAAAEAEPAEAVEAVSGSKARGPSGRSKGSKSKGSKGVQKGKAKGGRTRGNNPVSQYKGVSWSASTQRWAAVMWDR